jgi:hypothetical protein
MKRFLLASAFSLMLAMPALASQCPNDMAAIDAALAAGPDLTAEQLAEVQALRAEGEAQHAAGDHDASVETLGKAKAILGIE